MDIYEVNNVRYANAEKTLIDMDLKTDRFGVIPFTASPDDIEDYGADLYNRAKAGEFGFVSDYVPPAE